MRNHLPAKYTCPKCNKTSSSKGYFCSFCGNKKEQPNSQFIEYDFDLFPKNTKTPTQTSATSTRYVQKVVISFSLVLFMGLAFYVPYTITKKITEHTKPKILEIDIPEQNKFQTIQIKKLFDIKTSPLNANNNAEFIENNFDIYYESSQLYNINEYFKTLTPEVITTATKMSLDTITSQTVESTAFAIKDNDYIVITKFKNREFAYSLEKILIETSYKTSIIDDFLLISNNKKFIDRNIESYKGSTKNLAKSGYFIDTINSLPKKGQVFVFIKTLKGLKLFEQTTKIKPPTTKLPIGIIVDDDKLYYIDFTF